MRLLDLGHPQRLVAGGERQRRRPPRAPLRPRDPDRVPAGGAGLITKSDRLEQVLAFPFGAGIGMTFDEAALLLELDDVYWTREGLLSVQLSFGLVAAARGDDPRPADAAKRRARVRAGGADPRRDRRVQGARACVGPRPGSRRWRRSRRRPRRRPSRRSTPAPCAPRSPRAPGISSSPTTRGRPVLSESRSNDPSAPGALGFRTAAGWTHATRVIDSSRVEAIVSRHPGDHRSGAHALDPPAARGRGCDLARRLGHPRHRGRGGRGRLRGAGGGALPRLRRALERGRPARGRGRELRRRWSLPGGRVSADQPVHAGMGPARRPPGGDLLPGSVAALDRRLRGARRRPADQLFPARDR